MKRPGFYEGVLIALLAGVIGSAIFTVFFTLFDGNELMRLLIASGGFCYALYLLNRSREPVGRVTAIAVWLFVAGLSWTFVPSLVLYGLIHTGLVWGIRSLYFYTSFVSALADLGLMALSLVIALWVGMHTDSVFISIWCFGLLQALFVFIPPNLLEANGLNTNFPNKAEKGTQRHSSESMRDADFEHAYRNAESALRKLSMRL